MPDIDLPFLDLLQRSIDRDDLPADVTNGMVLAAIMAVRSESVHERAAIANDLAAYRSKVNEEFHVRVLHVDQQLQFLKDEMNHNPLYWIKTQHRVKVTIGFLMWVAAMTAIGIITVTNGDPSLFYKFMQGLGFLG